MTISASGRTLDMTYANARAKFLEAAADAGAEVTSFPHPLIGLHDEELAIDVAQLGPDNAANVLVIVSGTHGAEGYAGSALQSFWLDERAGDLTGSELQVVLIHGLNPVGFSWVRRVNEDNVDLNRNFVDWTAPPSNDRYSEIADLLVPAEWTEEAQAESIEALFVVAGEVGMDEFQQIISGGQYDHPKGLFHGGSGPVWSHRWLVEHLPQLVGQAHRVALVDLHTGLGDSGHGELISHDMAGDPGYDRGTAWWGDVRSMRDGESVSASLNGDWLAGLDALLPNTEVTAVALEFGTVDVISVLQALRADAWLHGYGDPRGDDAPAIRAQVRAAFADDDPAWLALLITRFDEVITQAATALSTN